MESNESMGEEPIMGNAETENGERMALELGTLPSFHVANIQNLLPKIVRGDTGIFVKDIEKI